jgi:hypothetical protein
VVAELDRDAHVFEHGDGIAPEVLGHPVRCVVEEAAGVDRHRFLARLGTVLEDEELDLGMGIERQSAIRRAAQRALQHVARVGVRRRPVRHEDVAEHSGCPGPPGQHLKRGRVGFGEHVCLVDAREAFDRRAVEPDALFEGVLQLRRRHRHGFQVSEHVGEPEAHEPDVTLFQRPEDEFLLLLHAHSVPHARVQWVTTLL